MNLAPETIERTEEVIGPKLLEILDDPERSFYVKARRLAKDLEGEMDFSQRERAQIIGKTLKESDIAERWGSRKRKPTYTINEEVVRDRYG